MREWLSGGVSPCQGEGRGFESRLALFLFVRNIGRCLWTFYFYKLFYTKEKVIFIIEYNFSSKQANNMLPLIIKVQLHTILFMLELPENFLKTS